MSRQPMHVPTEEEREVLDRLTITPSAGRVFLFSEEARERLKEAGGAYAVEICEESLRRGFMHDSVEVVYVEDDDAHVEEIVRAFEEE